MTTSPDLVSLEMEPDKPLQHRRAKGKYSYQNQQHNRAADREDRKSNGKSNGKAAKGLYL